MVDHLRDQWRQRIAQATGRGPLWRGLGIEVPEGIRASLRTILAFPEARGRIGQVLMQQIQDGDAEQSSLGEVWMTSFRDAARIAETSDGLAMVLETSAYDVHGVVADTPAETLFESGTQIEVTAVWLRSDQQDATRQGWMQVLDHPITGNA